MTLKQLKLLKNLETSPTIMDAAKKAGYSPGARNMYRPDVLKHIETQIASNPEAIKARYEELLERCKAKGKVDTERAVLDSLARINGMNKDRAEITTKTDVDPTIPTEEVVKSLEQSLAAYKKSMDIHKTNDSNDVL